MGFATPAVLGLVRPAIKQARFTTEKAESHGGPRRKATKRFARCAIGRKCDAPKFLPLRGPPWLSAFSVVKILACPDRAPRSHQQSTPGAPTQQCVNAIGSCPGPASQPQSISDEPIDYQRSGDDSSRTLRAVKASDNLHCAQCLTYLKATDLRLCILLNFGKPRPEIKRVVQGL